MPLVTNSLRGGHTHTNIHTHKHTHKHTHTQTHTQTCTHTYTHMQHAHANTHTYTYNCLVKSNLRNQACSWFKYCVCKLSTKA